MENEIVSNTTTEKLDSILKSINDMKITQNKLISTVNFIHDVKKKQDKEFGDIECKLHSLSKNIEDFFNENKLLKNTISNIESRLSILEAKPSHITSEEMYSEIIDRQARSRNIICFNVPESLSHSATNETQSILEIFQQMGTQEIIPANILRLGKVSNQCHPIRITLQNQHDVFTVLKNKNKLRHCDKFKLIKFSTDRTLLQRNYFKSILDELNNRKSAGESDLFIKYVNNIPTVSKNVRNHVQMPIS